MIKCRVKVKTGKDLFQYSGLFISSWHALMDAAYKFSHVEKAITVTVIK